MLISFFRLVSLLEYLVIFHLIYLSIVGIFGRIRDLFIPNFYKTIKTVLMF